MKNIKVIGAGTMGNGIAHVFAQYGYDVVICDISAPALEKALATIDKNLSRMVDKQKISAELKQETLSRLKTSTDIKTAVADADLVIEAATENLALKLKLFTEIDQHAPAHCILATNTSSISITQIAAATKRPEQVIGMHFMNPVPMMKLVEIIRGFLTTTEVCDIIFDISRKLDKVPVEVKDYPGFVANRLLMVMINEAINTLYDGICDVEDIDNIAKLGMSHLMGPLQLADFIGLDVCLSIMKVIHEGFGNPKYAPSPLLINMVNAGLLGVKSGSGFYLYSKDSKDLVVNPRFEKRFQ